MASRQPIWSFQEAVVLLDGYLESLKAAEPRIHIIKRVSAVLRTLAIKNGREIDDIYRNENGISYQMQSMDSAWKGHTVYVPATKLFKSVVDLYRTDLSGFQKSLKEAMAMIDKNTSKQDSFVSWAGDNGVHYSAGYLLSCLKVISEYAKASVFSITSVQMMKKIRIKMEADRVFRYTHKSEYKNYLHTIDIYCRYLEEQNKANAATQEKAGLGEKEKAAVDKIVDIIQSTPNVAPYDRTEAIFLIDLFLSLNEQPNINWNDVYAQASEVLRRRALKFDRNIDENFRTVAEIARRLTEIHKLMNDDDAFAHPLFKELVQLYKADRKRYEAQAAMVTAQLNKLGLFVVQKNVNETASVESTSDVEKDGELTYDFSNPVSLAFTKPIFISYFGKRISVESWRTVYTELLKCLNEEHSEIFHKIAGRVFGSAQTPLVATEDQKSSMLSPYKFADGLYVDVKYSATAIMKRVDAFLKACKVDYSHVIIKYRKISEETHVNAELGQGRRYLRDDKETYYRWLSEDQKLAEATCRSYVSAINSAEAFSRTKIDGKYLLLSTNDYKVVKETIAALMANPEFKELNAQQHNRYFAALKSFAKYCGITTLTVNVPHDDSPQCDEKLLHTLSVHYAYGYNINSPIECMRFRVAYQNDHGCECPYDNDALLNKIRECGFVFEGKLYIIAEDTIMRVLDLLRKEMASGSVMFYYGELYAANEAWMYDSRILSSDMLKALLDIRMPMYQHKNTYFLADAVKRTEMEAIATEVVRVWGDKCIRTSGELKELLPYIPEDKIRYAMSTSREFVWTATETYTRVSTFIISESDLIAIRDAAEKACQISSSVCFEDLPLENVFSENYELSESAIYDLVYMHLSDRFDRNKKVITKKGEAQSVSEAISTFCKGKETCTYQDILDVMQNASGSISYPLAVDLANAAMVRVSEEDFVSDGSVNFDVQATDDVLDSIVHGEAIPLKEIVTFSNFPFCGYAWNWFVLESYCRRFSRRFRYACAASNSHNVGVIQRNSSTKEYHDLMVHAVADSVTELNEESVFDFLVEHGYIIRRRYSDITRLIKEADNCRKGSV